MGYQKIKQFLFALVDANFLYNENDINKEKKINVYHLAMVIYVMEQILDC